MTTQYMTIKDVANALKFSVSKVKRLIIAGDLPTLKSERSVRISEDDFRAFEEKRRVLR